MNQKREQMLAELEAQLVTAATALVVEANRRMTDGGAHRPVSEDSLRWMLGLSLDILAEAKRPAGGHGAVDRAVEQMCGPMRSQRVLFVTEFKGEIDSSDFKDRLARFLEELDEEPAEAPSPYPS